MNYDEFFTAVIAYYGDYTNQAQKRVVYTYVKTNVPERMLTQLFKNLIQIYSNSYKTPPGVAEIAKAQQTNIQTLAEQAWLSVVNVSEMESILCTDMILQETIRSMGGWYEFCQYKERNSAACHRDFVDRYKNIAMIPMQHKPRVLRGYGDMFWNQDIDYNKVKVIGDKELAKQMMQEIKSYATNNTYLQKNNGDTEFKKLEYKELITTLGGNQDEK